MSKQQIKAISKDFGEIIHVTRTKMHISQKSLSEIAGISDVYLRNIENGNHIVTWLIWLKLCSALDIDIKSLQRKYILPEMELHHFEQKR